LVWKATVALVSVRFEMLIGEITTAEATVVVTVATGPYVTVCDVSFATGRTS
jgi:hypothetical protein